MESEEAIMENENNSNVESESNTRDQQVLSMEEGSAEDTAETRPVEGEVLSVSDVEHNAQHNFGSKLVDSEATQWTDADGSTSAPGTAQQIETSTSAEQKQLDCAETVTASVEGETDLPDYEDFVDEEDNSHPVASQPAESKESVDHMPVISFDHMPVGVIEAVHPQSIPEIAAESVEQRSSEEFLEEDHFISDQVNNPSEAVSRSQGMTADDVSAPRLESVDKKDGEGEKNIGISNDHERFITASASALQQEGGSGDPGIDRETLWEDDIDLLGDDSQDVLKRNDHLPDAGSSGNLQATLETRCDDTGEESSTVCDEDDVSAEKRIDSRDSIEAVKHDGLDGKETLGVDNSHSIESGPALNIPGSALAPCESIEQNDGVRKCGNETLFVEEIEDTVASEADSVSQVDIGMERVSTNVSVKATNSEDAADQNTTAVEVTEGKEDGAVVVEENNECQLVHETHEANSSAGAQDEVRLDEQSQERTRPERVSEVAEVVEVEELEETEHSTQDGCKEGREGEFTKRDEELSDTECSKKQNLANEAQTEISAKVNYEETQQKGSELLSESSQLSGRDVSVGEHDTAELADRNDEMKQVTDSEISNVASSQQMNVENESVAETCEEEDMDVTAAEIITTQNSESGETDVNAEDVQEPVVKSISSETNTQRPESNADDMTVDDLQKCVIEPTPSETNTPRSESHTEDMTVDDVQDCTVEPPSEISTQRPESNTENMTVDDVQKSMIEPTPFETNTQRPESNEEGMTVEDTENSMVKPTPSETSTERPESSETDKAAEDTQNSTMELTSSDSGMPPVTAAKPRDGVNDTESSSNQNKVEETIGSPSVSAEKTDSASESASVAETKLAEVASSQSTVSNETQASENDDDDDDIVEITAIKKEVGGVEETDTAKQVLAETRSERLSTENIKQEHLGSDKSGNVEEEVVVLDDEGEVVPVKKETGDSKAVENGLGIQISAVSGNQQQLHANAEHSPSTPTTTTTTTSTANHKNETPKSKSSKSKVQTCIVCNKTCKCKYNIVRNGDIRHLCDDTCFKQFRKSPSSYLKGKEDVKTKKAPSKDSPAVREALNSTKTPNGAKQDGQFKTCAVCQLMNVNMQQPFCNWKGLDFCGESCLGKFLGNLNTSCSFCHAYIPIDMRATFCLKIGNDMRPFCKQRCYNEFKKKLRLCAFCQRDIAGVPTAFTAMVGTDGKFREFCSQPCLKKMEMQVNDVEVLSVGKGNLKQETITCSVCEKQGAMKHTVIFQGKVNKLCSDPCMSAFQYSNKINMNKCDSCGTICTTEEAQAHFVQFEGQLKRFCSDQCVNQFRKNNSKVVPCAWCATKKLNFDMIERLDAENKYQMFCSLNCLSLYRVNLQAKSNQAISCDQCKKVVPAQYHLTMSDASVRNFCSYACVMTFQSQFTKHTTPTFGAPTPSTLSQPGQVPSQPPGVANIPQKGPGSKGRGRMSTRQASAKDQQPSSFPVIANVMSLAPQAGDQVLPPSTAHTSVLSPPPGINSNMVPSGDGKHQILIQAAAPKAGKNKSLQCRPLTQTKATSCRPHSQNKEIQTDEVPAKSVCVPVPVPVYIPMPCVMFTAPTPKLVPFPLPIPVPIFIPTTRKSSSGIFKAIKEIVERMPSDPLEAELLMMAEAVASDKGPGDSDTDSEADAGGEDFAVPEEEVMRPAAREDENLMMRKREGQGEEDMIQMALRMAEEMSGPIEDLESSVEPVAVSADPPRQQQQSMQYDAQVDDEYIPPRSGRGRAAKRATRGRPQASRAKRQRTDASYTEDDSARPEPAAVPQSMEPPPDANYRLKFTYGVNAWRHWVINKNAQLEKTKQSAGSYRVRLFPTDILKCTTDELNFTLCMFIKDVRKPNGEEYSPDSIFYLCLGIQQYIYENGRIDNIFTDMYFEKFTDSLHEVLKTHQPKVNPQGQMLCRIEEEHLWESKQLGAHSPYVLLNTLIYFHTKHFILKTAQEHMSLSFAQILKHWKKGMPVKGQSASSGKNVSLRFYCLANGKKDGLAARKNKEGVPVYEVTENFDNPLRCPVKLYEFFLSKCPESIKNRNDIFYPVPERSCVPDSPVWYSTQSIDIHTMDKMLTRVLLVREIQEAHLHAQPIYL